MRFEVKHTLCGEIIVISEHEDDKMHVTLMRNHKCPADGLDYLIEASRGFKYDPKKAK